MKHGLRTKPLVWRPTTSFSVASDRRGVFSRPKKRFYWNIRTKVDIEAVQGWLIS
jgi:hypothetical protein